MSISFSYDVAAHFLKMMIFERIKSITYLTQAYSNCRRWVRNAPESGLRVGLLWTTAYAYGVELPR